MLVLVCSVVIYLFFQILKIVAHVAILFAAVIFTVYFNSEQRIVPRGLYVFASVCVSSARSHGTMSEAILPKVLAVSNKIPNLLTPCKSRHLSSWLCLFSFLDTYAHASLIQMCRAVRTSVLVNCIGKKQTLFIYLFSHSLCLVKLVLRV